MDSMVQLHFNNNKLLIDERDFQDANILRVVYGTVSSWMLAICSPDNLKRNIK